MGTNNTSHDDNNALKIKIIKVLSTYLIVGSGYIPIKIRGSIDTIILYHLNYYFAHDTNDTNYLYEFIRSCCIIISLPYEDGGLSTIIKNIHSFLISLNNNTVVPQEEIKYMIMNGIRTCESIVGIISSSSIPPLNIIHGRNIDLLDDIITSIQSPSKKQKQTQQLENNTKTIDIKGYDKESITGNSAAVDNINKRSSSFNSDHEDVMQSKKLKIINEVNDEKTSINITNTKQSKVVVEDTSIENDEK